MCPADGTVTCPGFSPAFGTDSSSPHESVFFFLILKCSWSDLGAGGAFTTEPKEECLIIDNLPSQAGEQCNTDTCYLNNKPKLDSLALQPAFHVSVSPRLL